MNTTSNELDGLRRYLAALQSGTTIRRGNVDVTQQEIAALKREIDYLESVLARLKGNKPM
jgi:polyhydroxyalkanoate synthesis regulator phasin